MSGYDQNGSLVSYADWGMDGICHLGRFWDSFVIRFWAGREFLINNLGKLRADLYYTNLWKWFGKFEFIPESIESQARD